MKSVIRNTLVVAAAAFAVSQVLAEVDRPAPRPPLATTRPATRPASRPTTGPAYIKKAQQPAEAEKFFANGPLPKFVIEADPKKLRGLNDNPRTHIHATIREVVAGQPDVTYGDVGMHLKGGPGSFRRVEDKPALNLNFDKFNKDQTYHGLDKILLNNSVQDPAYMWENLCGWMFREAGGCAARASNARVTLNGRDLGLFVIKEGFDTVFFKKLFKDHTGNLYEGSFTEVNANMPVHFGVHRQPPADPTNKAAKKAYDAEVAADRKAASAKMQQLVDACNEKDRSLRREKLEKVLDVDKFLTFMACEAIIGHWDGYGGNRNNYRVYHDPSTDRLVFVAHGMDQVFQRTDYPLIGMTNGMVNLAVLGTMEDKQRYFDRVAKIRSEALTNERVLAELDRVSARIMPLMEAAGKDAVRQHKEMTANTRQRIIERFANIDQQLKTGLPKPLKFDSGNIAKLAAAAWEVKVMETAAVVDKTSESGKPRLRVKCPPNGQPVVGSWRLPVLLEKGRYVFEGRMKTVGVVPYTRSTTAATGGAGIRISGDKKPFRLTGDNDWQTVTYEFEVTDQSPDTVLVCDLNGKAGQALFDIESLRLRKKG